MSEVNPKITIKEVANYFNCTERTAYKYLSDIKTEYDCPIVTKQHFENYFKVKIS